MNLSPLQFLKWAIQRLYQSKNLLLHINMVRLLAIYRQRRMGIFFGNVRSEMQIVHSANIPGLSWIAEIKPEGNSIIIGSKVEQFSNAIVEGVWDNEYSVAGLRKAANLFGSAVLWEEELEFIPPKHVWEYLFVLVNQRRQCVLVSNSLCFLLSKAEIKEDHTLLSLIDKELVLSTQRATARGIDRYDPLVTEYGDYKFFRMMFYNFTINHRGNVRILPHKIEVAPSNFNSYQQFLVDKISTIADNGASHNRRHRLVPITPISGGYDSPCVAALAKKAGYEDALCLNITVKDVDDCGGPIAEALGMKVIAAIHPFGEQIAQLRTAISDDYIAQANEFLAGAGAGDDLAFLAFEPYLANRIFLSGAFGDSIWSKQSNLSPGLPVKVIYGKSLCEFRLRVGFAWVPLPAIGARFPSLIKSIAHAAEMEAYSIGGEYDRPFPRRVLEEAGIQRGSFARQKAAISPTITNRALLYKSAVLKIMERYRL